MKNKCELCTVLVLGRNATLKQSYITSLFWDIYWKDCIFERVLLTQTKAGDCEKKYDRIIFTDEEELIWGDRLKIALDNINTPYVIFLTEDYFVYSKISNKRILHYIDVANKENAGAIRLNPPALFSKKYNNELSVLDGNVEYRITGQPTLFRTDYLKHFAGMHLSPWQFERKGTELSRNYTEKVFVTVENVYPNVHAWSHNSWTRKAIRLMKKNRIPSYLYENDNVYPIRLVIKNIFFYIVIHIAPHTFNRTTTIYNDKMKEKKLKY